MGYSFKEIAGWLREDADIFEMIGVEFLGEKALKERAQKVRNRAAQVEAMGWQPITRGAIPTQRCDDCDGPECESCGGVPDADDCKVITMFYSTDIEFDY